MIWIYLISTYVLSWILIWIGVRIERCSEVYDGEESEIMTDLEFYWWLLLIPFINVISSIVFFIKGIVLYIQGTDIDVEDILKAFFGKEKEEN